MRTIQKEIHDFGTFVDKPPSVAQGARRTRLRYLYQAIKHHEHHDSILETYSQRFHSAAHREAIAGQTTHHLEKMRFWLVFFMLFRQTAQLEIPCPNGTAGTLSDAALPEPSRPAVTNDSLLAISTRRALFLLRPRGNPHSTNAGLRPNMPRAATT